MVNEHVAVFPLPSVAVLVTELVPTVKVLPEIGFETTVAFPQLSLAVTENVTTAEHLPEEAF